MRRPTPAESQRVMQRDNSASAISSSPDIRSPGCRRLWRRCAAQAALARRREQVGSFHARRWHDYTEPCQPRRQHCGRSGDWSNFQAGRSGAPAAVTAGTPPLYPDWMSGFLQCAECALTLTSNAWRKRPVGVVVRGVSKLILVPRAHRNPLPGLEPGTGVVAHGCSHLLSLLDE
jgi:hypothetical protein